SKLITPSVGSKKRTRRLDRVVLPEPVGPTTPRRLPAGSSKDTSSRTGWPFVYSKDTLWKTILPFALARGRAFGLSGTSSVSSRTEWYLSIPARDNCISSVFCPTFLNGE